MAIAPKMAIISMAKNACVKSTGVSAISRAGSMTRRWSILPNAATPIGCFFGATVTYADDSGAEQTVTIVGLDEVDPARGRVSWISPIAAALIKHSVGDTVGLRTPAGLKQIEIVDVRYEAIA